MLIQLLSVPEKLQASGTCGSINEVLLAGFYVVCFPLMGCQTLRCSEMPATEAGKGATPRFRLHAIKPYQ